MTKLMMLIFWVFIFIEGVSQDTVKCWGINDKLKWSDFRGSVPKTNGSASDGASCSSVPKTYTLKENDSTYIYKVRATFNRYKSWAKAKDTSKYLLTHEQLHFDITELYTRKMRKAFKELGNWTEANANAYRALIKKLHTDHIAIQNDYDAKSVHGTLKKAQEEWVNKIHAELEALKEFASTAKDCN